MKKRNRGGFTLTDIITIIAIALIIVGMMVATLVSVADVKRYAKLQESEQQEMQSKLEELMALLNGDWQTDFENTLAEKLAEVDLNLSGEESQTAIAAAVSAALTEYGAAKGGSVGLTGEQLEEIVNRTLAGSLTEAQVESIVKKYSGSDALTSSQIRRIVEQAIENSLTAGQIRQAVDDALTSNAKLSEIDRIIKSISEDVEAIQKNALTKEDVENIVKKYLGELPTPSVPTEFDAEDIVFSFAAISDIHVQNSTTDAYSTKFKKALEQLRDRAAMDDEDGIDAVFAVGDLIDNGSTGAYDQMYTFKSVYESVFSPTEVPMIFTVGNHDVEGSYAWNANTKYNTNKLHERLGEEYFLTDVDKEMLEAENNRHCVINGFHVISVVPQSSSPVTYSDSTKAWLDETLAEITEENPDQFVFILTHPMIYDTVYGSDLGTYWYTEDLTEILSKYSQVVTFGGHLHFPLNDPRSIMQTAFTSLGCGSVRYMAIEDGGYEDMAGSTTMNDKDEFSQGLLVQIDGNGNMRITRMDFYNEETIGEAWIVSYPQEDGSHLTKYSKERGNEENNKAPVLSSVNIAEKGTTNAGVRIAVEFAAATDDEFAHHYVVELKDNTGTTLTTKKILSDFYRHGDPADMKDSWDLSLGSLADGDYSVTVTAYDSWGAASAPVVVSFTIKGQELDPSKLPEAYVDINFTDGKITDAKGNVTITNKGASVGKTDVTIGGKTYQADALLITESGQYVLCEFDDFTTPQSVKNWAEGGFSVEAFYVMGEKGEAQGIVCGTEQYPRSTGTRGGWGLAEDASGQPYFVTATSGNKYCNGPTATSATSTSELVHIVAVYDYANKLQCMYINGVAVGTGTEIPGEFVPATVSSGVFNQFCLGADAYTGDVIDFPSVNMTMVDAKIYSQALTATQAKLAYDAAIESLEPTTEPSEPEFPEAYVDFEFAGEITDAKGNVTITNKGASTEKTKVTVGGKTYETDALQITENGQYVLCQFNELTTTEAVKAWAEGGFTVEAFYVMGQKSGVQGIVCATEQYPRSTGTRGGWGIAENAGKPYFITGVSGNAYVSGPTAASVTSTSELVHVMAVYDYENKIQYLYINGVAVGAGTAVTGEFAPAPEASGVFNQFCLGADASSTEPVDFLTPAMTMVDAKIYSQALTAEQAKAAYDAAIEGLGEPIETPEPSEPELPEAYADFEFAGEITDAKGNVTVTNKGASVGKTSVTVNGETYETDALMVTESGQYVLCEFKNLTDAAAVKAWAEKGFSVEAFYVMNSKGDVQGIVCGTETVSGIRGGWGIAENAGKPYFITGTTGAYCSGPTAGAVSSTSELVHVLAVYDFESKKQYLYINGTAVGSGQTISGSFVPAGNEACNRFCLGADYRAEVNVNDQYSIDYLTQGMTMVDAKLYSQALTAEQVKAAYDAAVAALQ